MWESKNTHNMYTFLHLLADLLPGGRDELAPGPGLGLGLHSMQNRSGRPIRRHRRSLVLGHVVVLAYILVAAVAIVVSAGPSDQRANGSVHQARRTRTVVQYSLLASTTY